VFVLPALRRMMGMRPEVRPLVRARLTHPLRSRPGLRQFLRGAYDGSSVSPVGGPGSHLLGDLADSNCLIVVPEETIEVGAGSTVDVLLMDGDF
jgi:molybdopterin molybdotransferase